jgi:hypothetical protein
MTERVDHSFEDLLERWVELWTCNASQTAVFFNFLSAKSRTADGSHASRESNNTVLNTSRVNSGTLETFAKGFFTALNCMTCFTCVLESGDRLSEKERGRRVRVGENGFAMRKKAFFPSRRCLRLPSAVLPPGVGFQLTILLTKPRSEDFQTDGFITNHKNGRTYVRTYLQHFCQQRSWSFWPKRKGEKCYESDFSWNFVLECYHPIALGFSSDLKKVHIKRLYI